MRWGGWAVCGSLLDFAWTISNASELRWPPRGVAFASEPSLAGLSILVLEADKMGQE